MSILLIQEFNFKPILWSPAINNTNPKNGNIGPSWEGEFWWEDEQLGKRVFCRDQ